MRGFATGGGALVFGLLVAVCVGLSGCCTSPPLPRESLVIEQPPEEAPKPPPVEKPPERAPAVRPPVEVREPPPPPPVIPPAVVAAIEDLGQKYPGLFVFDKEKGQFRFNSDITFDSGSNVVKPEARSALMKLAQILSTEQVRDRTLTIVGHTDNVPVKKRETIARLKSLGKAADNQGLSEARAEAVAEVLMAGGVEAARMVTQGRGQSVPIADNLTVEGKAKNRRVDIFVTPSGGRASSAGTVNFGSGR